MDLFQKQVHVLKTEKWVDVKKRVTAIPGSSLRVIREWESNDSWEFKKIDKTKLFTHKINSIGQKVRKSPDGFEKVSKLEFYSLIIKKSVRMEPYLDLIYKESRLSIYDYQILYIRLFVPD